MHRSWLDWLLYRWESSTMTLGARLAGHAARRGVARSSRQNRRRSQFSRHCRLEALEVRVLPHVSISSVVPATMASGKSQYLVLQGSDNDVTTGLANLTYSATSSNTNVTASVVTGGRSVLMHVTGKDANNADFEGDLTFRLFEDLAPVATSRFIENVENQDYDSLIFHRIIQDFMAQGGDPLGTGSGGIGTQFKDEYSRQLTFTSNGLLAMANSGDDTNRSQFFITDTDRNLATFPQHLNFNHTIFGILTGGFDIFTKLIATPVSGSSPTTPPVITSASMFTDTQTGVLRITPADTFTGTASISVHVENDATNHTDFDQADTSFDVTVTADTVNDRPFLGPVTNIITAPGTPVSFTVQGIDLENDPLSFVVRDAVTFGTPSNVNFNVSVTVASGTNPAVATITLTPSATLTGTIDLLIGVRDQTNRDTNGGGLDARSNFDTQVFQLSIRNTAPQAAAGAEFTPRNTPAVMQFAGNDGDTGATQTLTFEIVTPPAHGTVTNFNASTGQFTYTPATDYVGTDAIVFRVLDNGGTDNGGNDTSANATLNIDVGIIAAPTTPTLIADSNDGLFDTTTFVTSFTPRFSVTGSAGIEARFLLNGTTLVTGEEDPNTPGTYHVNLSHTQLLVGENTIQATLRTPDGTTSSAGEATTFIYAPSYENIYTVAGTFGSDQTLSSKLADRQGRFQNEVGYFRVDGPDFNIGGILPGQAGYAAAALNSASRQVLFDSTTGKGHTGRLNLEGGDLVAFYLIADSTSANFLAKNPTNAAGTLPHAFFSVQAANPDGVDHMRMVGDPTTGQVQLRWEDTLGGGDLDYNDTVVNINPGSTVRHSVAQALRIPGAPSTGQTALATFTLETPKRAWDSNSKSPPTRTLGEFGLYLVSDTEGTVNGLRPGEAGYQEAVFASSTRQVMFNAGIAVGNSRTLEVANGGLVGFYYLPAGSHEAFFSFDEANVDRRQHFRWTDPEHVAASTDSPTHKKLHVMDKLFGDESDFDSYLISIDLVP